MMDWKKQVIADALSDLEDDFVAEAVEYKKEKFIWKYKRELVTMAACAAVLFMVINVIRMVPIGRSNETSSAEPVPEMFPQTTITEPSESEVIEVVEVTVVPEKEVENKNVATQEMVSDIDKAIGAESKLVWLSAEEILAKDIDIFMGTVTDKKVYRTTGEREWYFTVATVEVEESIRSQLTSGDTCKIYLPVAKAGDIRTSTSNSGDLENLKVGSRAIFMPHKATETAKDIWLKYQDYAEYYFDEGIRFLFLETETGTSYATDVYEVEGGKEASLEEIARYLRGLLEKE
jgi:hypothetical protein